MESANSVLRLLVLILTDSRLMFDKNVCDDLAGADAVLAKMDTGNRETFSPVAGRTTGLLFGDVLKRIELLRSRFKGELCLQITFITANKHFPREIAEGASLLSPDEVQATTPSGARSFDPLSPSQMGSVKGEADSPGNVITACQAPRPAAVPRCLYETWRRRTELCSRLIN